jgi:small conductance mechanosensitive channel
MRPVDELSTEQISQHVDTAIELGMNYGPRLLLAIIVLVAGLWIINRFVRVFRATLEARSLEATLSSFLTNLTSVVLKILLLISVASMVGIETTSFVAVLAAASLAIGLSLQGSLANLAGGVLILLFRPYRVGEFIEAQGVGGTVQEIQIFTTVLKTPDNKVITVPNGAVSNGIITNYSREATRRVDFEFGIGYGDDIAKAKSVIKEVLGSDERIMGEPEPVIVVSSLGDSSVNLTVRVWAAGTDFWGLKFDLTEKVKLAFDANGISIPFPQRDVHLYQK